MRRRRPCSPPRRAALLTACGPKTHLELDLRTVAVTRAPDRHAGRRARATGRRAAAGRAAAAAAARRRCPAVAPPRAVPPSPPPAPRLPEGRAVRRPGQAGDADRRLHPPAAGTFVAERPRRSPATGKPASGRSRDQSVVVSDAADATTVVGQQVDSWRVERHRAAHQEHVASRSTSSCTPSTRARRHRRRASTSSGWRGRTRCVGDLTFQPTGNGLEILPSPVQVASNDGAVRRQPPPTRTP